MILSQMMSCGLFKNIASHICITLWFTICVFYFELFRCPSVSLHCFGQMHWSWGVKISHCIGGFDANSRVQQYHSMNACNDILGIFWLWASDMYFITKLSSKTLLRGGTGSTTSCATTKLKSFVVT